MVKITEVKHTTPREVLTDQFGEVAGTLSDSTLDANAYPEDVRIEYSERMLMRLTVSYLVPIPLEQT